MWKNRLDSKNNNKRIIKSLKCRICVSSGFYLRQMINDIKNELGIGIMIYDINRVNIINS